MTGEQYPPMDYVPHTKALGVRIVEMEKGSCLLYLPYSEHLVGDPETGVIHGGVITAVLDNASGAAVHLSMGRATSIATIDLRIDYMKPATPGEGIYAAADCFKKTKNIGFVRGLAYHHERSDPIATTIATFMLSSNQTRKMYGTDG